MEQRKKFSLECQKDVLLRKEKSKNPKHAVVQMKAKQKLQKILLKNKSLKEAIITG